MWRLFHFLSYKCIEPTYWAIFSLFKYSICRSDVIYSTCRQFQVEPFFEASAKPLINKPYKRDPSESRARCSPVTPHMKRDSLRPPWLFQSLVCVWQTPEITLGFHKSHPCVDESLWVFYSRAEPDPVMRMQNPSLFTTPWQPLSDLVILHCVICATSDKTAVNSREPFCHSQVYFYMWKIRR